MINQDTFYHEEECSNHVRDPATNLINWEVMQAFNMEKMYKEINKAKESLMVCIMCPTWEKKYLIEGPISLLLIQPKIKGASRCLLTFVKPANFLHLTFFR